MGSPDTGGIEQRAPPSARQPIRILELLQSSGYPAHERCYQTVVRPPESAAAGPTLPTSRRDSVAAAAISAAFDK
jgi:hypothetical protein